MRDSLPGLASYTVSQTVLHTYGTGGDNPPVVLVLRLPSSQPAQSPAGRADIATTLAPFSHNRAYRVLSYANTGDARLVSGDVLRIPPIRTGAPAAAATPAPRPMAAPILYEDDALIAIDKPSGLAVHGGSGIAFGLIEQLRAARPDARFLELVHREYDSLAARSRVTDLGSYGRSL